MKINKISEMKTQPRRAGSATLNFVQKEQEKPSRAEGNITIPFNLTTEYLELKGGSQFIVAYPEQSEEIYFGGQDEMPFLTRLDGLSIKDLRIMENENVFYESLVPPLIALLQEIRLLSNKNNPVDYKYDESRCSWEAKPKRSFDKKLRRQGDLFAYPVVKLLAGRSDKEGYYDYETKELSWGDIMSYLRYVPTDVESHRLYNTRHELTGRIVRIPYFFVRASDPEEICIIGSGEVSAPDHAPMLLKEPHIILQSGMGMVTMKTRITTKD